jgi:hypothetical protein
MSAIASRNRRAQKKKAKGAAHHANVSGLPKSLVTPFLRLVKHELRMVPCKDGHAWCRGTYRDQEHCDAWHEAFDNLWTTMEEMTDLPERLVAPLAAVVRSRRDVPPVEEQHGPKWEEWLERDDAATWELFVTTFKIDGRCMNCQQKAIAELAL